MQDERDPAFEEGLDAVLARATRAVSQTRRRLALVIVVGVLGLFLGSMIAAFMVNAELYSYAAGFSTWAGVVAGSSAMGALVMRDLLREARSIEAEVQEFARELRGPSEPSGLLVNVGELAARLNEIGKEWSGLITLIFRGAAALLFVIGALIAIVTGLT